MVIQHAKTRKGRKEKYAIRTVPHLRYFNHFTLYRYADLIMESGLPCSRIPCSVSTSMLQRCSRLP